MVYFTLNDSVLDTQQLENARLIGMFWTQNNQEIFCPLEFPLDADTSYLWITADISNNAREGSSIDLTLTGIYSSTDLNIIPDSCPKAHREILLTRTTLYRPGDFNSKNYRIPAIVTAGDGSLVAASDKRKYNDMDLPEDIDILVNRSTDGGRTWSKPYTLAEGTGVGHGFGDCALVRTNEEGGLLAVFVGGVGFWQSRPDNPLCTYLCRSHDNGQSWSKPEDITHFILGPDCVIPAHRSWWSSFFASGAGLRTSSGRIMFAAAVREDSLWRANNYVFYSDDNGETWQCSERASVGGDEAKLVELSDGRILLSIRTNGQRWYNISDDGGVTWHASTSVWTDIEAPACNGDILRCTAPDGRTLLLHSLPYGKERKDVSVFVSFDEGKTWPLRRTIVPYPSAYSSLCQLPDGTIGLYVEEAYNDGVNYSMVFYNFSIDWLLDTSGK